MAYQSWSVVFGEQPSAAKWNILGTNDAFFNTQVGDDFSSGTNSTVWWEEIGRTTLGSAGDTITVSSIPARKYLRVLLSLASTGGTIVATLRFNNDSSTNYARKSSANFAAAADVTSENSLGLSPADADDMFGEVYIINNASQEKLTISHLIIRETAGAATVPSSRETVGKWANTSAQISRIDVVNTTGTGDYVIGSEVIVLGHD